MVQELIGEACPVVLDPSMLLTKEEWESQIVPYKHPSKGYIVRFVFNKDKKTDDFIKQLSEETKLPVYEIGGHILTNLRHRDRIFSGPIGPMEWLGLIHDTEYVVTDSFHGAAFSIIFEKNLFVSLSSCTNSRLITLLDHFNLQHRVIGAQKLNVSDKINYERIRKIMEEKRERSLAYLIESLK